MSINDTIRRRLVLQLLGRRNSERPRIFGIGLSKTATTTLCDALSILGYKTIHYAPIVQIEKNEADFIWPWWIEEYDAMADLPVAAVYPELSRRFPNSTFILTTRNEDAWLVSARKHFNQAAFDSARDVEKFRQGVLLNKHMYGANVFDEARFRQAFRNHTAEVRQHFDGDPRYHELDICGGDRWERLCQIVGRPVPDVPFPKSNVRAEIDKAKRAD